MFEEIGTFENDRDSMKEFLMQVRNLLIVIAFDGYFGRINWRQTAYDFAPDHLEYYQRAMREYLESGQFEILLTAVSELGNAAVQAGGLGGAQLFVKRETVRASERRFLRFPTMGGFRRLVQAVDILLDSILNAAGIGSALSELKDVAGLLPERRPDN